MSLACKCKQEISRRVSSIISNLPDSENRRDVRGKTIMYLLKSKTMELLSVTYFSDNKRI